MRKEDKKKKKVHLGSNNKILNPIFPIKLLNWEDLKVLAPKTFSLIAFKQEQYVYVCNHSRVNIDNPLFKGRRESWLDNITNLSWEGGSNSSIKQRKKNQWKGEGLKRSRQKLLVFLS